MAGTVASPTPMVPTAEDSTSVIATPSRCSRCARDAAVIQPAVPPPTMTTERSGAELLGETVMGLVARTWLHGKAPESKNTYAARRDRAACRDDRRRRALPQASILRADSCSFSRSAAVAG